MSHSQWGGQSITGESLIRSLKTCHSRHFLSISCACGGPYLKAYMIGSAPDRSHRIVALVVALVSSSNCAFRISSWSPSALLGLLVISSRVNPNWHSTFRATSVMGCGDREGYLCERASNNAFTRVVLPVHWAPIMPPLAYFELALSFILLSQEVRHQATKASQDE